MSSNTVNADEGRPPKIASDKDAVVVAIRITRDEKAILDAKAGLARTATYIKHHLRLEGGLFDPRSNSLVSLGRVEKTSKEADACRKMLLAWCELGDKNTHRKPPNAQDVFSAFATATGCNFEDVMEKAAMALLADWAANEVAGVG